MRCAEASHGQWAEGRGEEGGWYCSPFALLDSALHVVFMHHSPVSHPPQILTLYAAYADMVDDRMLALIVGRIVLHKRSRHDERIAYWKKDARLGSLLAQLLRSLQVTFQSSKNIWPIFK